MKIKSSKFISGHLSQIHPYEVKGRPAKVRSKYKLIEGYSYLICLPDGGKLKGVYYNKGLENAKNANMESNMVEQSPWPSQQIECHGVHLSQAEVDDSSIQHEPMEVDEEHNLLPECPKSCTSSEVEPAQRPTCVWTEDNNLDAVIIQTQQAEPSDLNGLQFSQMHLSCGIARDATIQESDSLTLPLEVCTLHEPDSTTDDSLLVQRSHFSSSSTKHVTDDVQRGSSAEMLNEIDERDYVALLPECQELVQQETDPNAPLKDITPDCSEASEENLTSEQIQTGLQQNDLAQQDKGQPDLTSVQCLSSHDTELPFKESIEPLLQDVSAQQDSVLLPQPEASLQHDASLQQDDPLPQPDPSLQSVNVSPQDTEILAQLDSVMFPDILQQVQQSNINDDEFLINDAKVDSNVSEKVDAGVSSGDTTLLDEEEIQNAISSGDTTLLLDEEEIKNAISYGGTTLDEISVQNVLSSGDTSLSLDEIINCNAVSSGDTSWSLDEISLQNVVSSGDTSLSLDEISTQKVISSEDTSLTLNEISAKNAVSSRDTPLPLNEISTQNKISSGDTSLTLDEITNCNAVSSGDTSLSLDEISTQNTISSEDTSLTLNEISAKNAMSSRDTPLSFNEISTQDKISSGDMSLSLDEISTQNVISSRDTSLTLDEITNCNVVSSGDTSLSLDEISTQNAMSSENTYLTLNEISAKNAIFSGDTPLSLNEISTQNVISSRDTSLLLDEVSLQNMMSLPQDCSSQQHLDEPHYPYKQVMEEDVEEVSELPSPAENHLTQNSEETPASQDQKEPSQNELPETMEVDAACVEEIKQQVESLTLHAGSSHKETELVQPDEPLPNHSKIRMDNSQQQIECFGKAVGQHIGQFMEDLPNTSELTLQHLESSRPLSEASSITQQHPEMLESLLQLQINIASQSSEVAFQRTSTPELHVRQSGLPEKSPEAPIESEVSSSRDRVSLTHPEKKKSFICRAKDSSLVRFTPYLRSLASGSKELPMMQEPPKNDSSDALERRNVPSNLKDTSLPIPHIPSLEAAVNDTMVSTIGMVAGAKSDTLSMTTTSSDINSSSSKNFVESLQSLKKPSSISETQTNAVVNIPSTPLKSRTQSSTTNVASTGNVLKVPTVSVCTVSPTTKPGNVRLMPSFASPVIQGKSPIFITPNQFKVLANICKQNSQKATALVVPNTHMKVAEDEVHVLSSDDEDGTATPSRHILTQSLQQQSYQPSPQQPLASSDNDTEFLLSCPLRQSFFGMERGGILRVCQLSLEFFRITNGNGSARFDIPLKEVSKLMVHHGLCGPVFFLTVSEDVRKQVQARFSFGISTFDPASSDPGKSYIVFVPSKKNDVERDNLGQAAVTTIMETISKHMLEKFNHRIEISTLSGGETSQLIALVLGVPQPESSQASPFTPTGHSLPLSSPASMTSPMTQVTSVTTQVVAPMVHQAPPSFVIVGGSQPINIVGSNSINITNNIFNINVPNNIKGSLTSPKTQIIVLAKKVASLSSADKSQEPRNRGPIVSLFTYPPMPGPGRMTITTEDYYCLNEGELLNDNIIDFYLKYFLEEHLDEETRGSVHLFSSFFYGKIISEDRSQEAAAGPLQMTPQQVRHSRVRTWTRHVDLFSKDFIIIPIIESSHWFLAVICFPGLKNAVIEHYQPLPGSSADEVENQVNSIRLKQPCILIFDSLGMIGHQTVTRTLREYLQEEWNLKKRNTMGEREFSENTFPGFNPSCPQQNNSTDCGVFVLKYVESFFKKPIRDFIMPISNTPDWFTQDAIREKRKEIQQLIVRLHGSDPTKPK